MLSPVPISVHALAQNLLQACEGNDVQKTALLLELVPSCAHEAFELDGEFTTILNLAAKHGALGVMKLLLSEPYRVDVNSEAGGSCALLEAVRAGQLDSVKLLLEHGADSNLADANGKTPLHWAVSHESDEILQILLSHGADTETENDSGKTPLELAIAMRHIDQACELARKGARLRRLEKAIRDNDKAEVERLMFNSDIERSIVRAYRDADGNHLLHYAVEQNACELIPVLCSMMGDVASAPNHDGKSPCHLAAQLGSQNVVRALPESLWVASLSQADKEGNTPLHQAAAVGNVSCCQLLRRLHASHRVDEAPNKEGVYPRDIARRHPSTSNVWDEPSFRREQLNYQLLKYISEGNYNSGAADVKDWLKAGASPNAADELTGHSALHLAVMRNAIDVIELLLQRGANPSLSDREGNTPFHLACQQKTNIARRMLTFPAMRYANINALNAAGKTPLDLLAHGGQLEPENLRKLGARYADDDDYWDKVHEFETRIKAEKRRVIAQKRAKARKLANAKKAVDTAEPEAPEAEAEPMKTEHEVAVETDLLLAMLRELTIKLREHEQECTQRGITQPPPHLHPYEQLYFSYELLEYFNQKIPENVNDLKKLTHLLELGANPNVRDRQSGETVLHRCVAAKKPKHLQLLLQWRANPFIADNNGNTPLHIACAHSKRCIPALINAFPSPSNWSVNLLNEQGQTPLDMVPAEQKVHAQLSQSGAKHAAEINEAAQQFSKDVCDDLPVHWEDKFASPLSVNFEAAGYERVDEESMLRIVEQKMRCENDRVMSSSYWSPLLRYALDEDFLPGEVYETIKEQHQELCAKSYPLTYALFCVRKFHEHGSGRNAEIPFTFESNLKNHAHDYVWFRSVDEYLNSGNKYFCVGWMRAQCPMLKRSNANSQLQKINTLLWEDSGIKLFLQQDWDVLLRDEALATLEKPAFPPKLSDWGREHPYITLLWEHSWLDWLLMLKAMMTAPPLMPDTMPARWASLRLIAGIALDMNDIMAECEVTADESSQLTAEPPYAPSAFLPFSHGDTEMLIHQLLHCHQNLMAENHHILSSGATTWKPFICYALDEAYFPDHLYEALRQYPAETFADFLKAHTNSHYLAFMLYLVRLFFEESRGADLYTAYGQHKHSVGKLYRDMLTQTSSTSRNELVWFKADYCEEPDTANTDVRRWLLHQCFALKAAESETGRNALNSEIIQLNSALSKLPELEDFFERPWESITDFTALARELNEQPDIIERLGLKGNQRDSARTMWQHCRLHWLLGLKAIATDDAAEDIPQKLLEQEPWLEELLGVAPGMHTTTTASYVLYRPVDGTPQLGIRLSTSGHVESCILSDGGCRYDFDDGEASEQVWFCELCQNTPSLMHWWKPGHLKIEVQKDKGSVFSPALPKAKSGCMLFVCQDAQRDELDAYRHQVVEKGLYLISAQNDTPVYINGERIASNYRPLTPGGSGFYTRIRQDLLGTLSPQRPIVIEAGEERTELATLTWSARIVALDPSGIYVPEERYTTTVLMGRQFRFRIPQSDHAHCTVSAKDSQGNELELHTDTEQGLSFYTLILPESWAAAPELHRVRLTIRVEGNRDYYKKCAFRILPRDWQQQATCDKSKAIEYLQRPKPLLLLNYPYGQAEELHVLAPLRDNFVYWYSDTASHVEPEQVNGNCMLGVVEILDKDGTLNSTELRDSIPLLISWREQGEHNDIHERVEEITEWYAKELGEMLDELKTPPPLGSSYDIRFGKEIILHRDNYRPHSATLLSKGGNITLYEPAGAHSACLLEIQSAHDIFHQRTESRRIPCKEFFLHPYISSQSFNDSLEQAYRYTHDSLQLHATDPRINGGQQEGWLYLRLLTEGETPTGRGQWMEIAEPRNGIKEYLAFENDEREHEFYWEKLARFLAQETESVWRKRQRISILHCHGMVQALCLHYLKDKLTTPLSTERFEAHTIRQELWAELEDHLARQFGLFLTADMEPLKLRKGLAPSIRPFDIANLFYHSPGCAVTKAELEQAGLRLAIIENKQEHSSLRLPGNPSWARVLPTNTAERTQAFERLINRVKSLLETSAAPLTTLLNAGFFYPNTKYSSDNLGRMPHYFFESLLAYVTQTLWNKETCTTNLKVVRDGCDLVTAMIGRLWNDKDGKGLALLLLFNLFVWGYIKQKVTYENASQAPGEQRPSLFLASSTSERFHLFILNILLNNYSKAWAEHCPTEYKLLPETAFKKTAALVAWLTTISPSPNFTTIATL